MATAASLADFFDAKSSTAAAGEQRYGTMARYRSSELTWFA